MGTIRQNRFFRSSTLLFSVELCVRGFGGQRSVKWRVFPQARPGMQALVWIVRFLIVVILVWFAVKNSTEVTLRGFLDQEYKAPLIFVMLVVFVAGVVIGLLAWIPTVVRQRREIARLKRAAQQQAAVAAIVPPQEGRDVPSTDIHGI
jgi:lipopolysaccharide assembly protein A